MRRVGMGGPVLLGGGVAETYADRVLATGPIAYWPLRETSGTVAQCLTNAAMNGTYARNVTDMGTGAGIGDGNTAPVFNGANDFVNIYSAALAAAFSGASGMLMVWSRVSGAGIWTDGLQHNSAALAADAVDNVYAAKVVANNTLWMRYRANNVSKSVTFLSGGNLAWFQWAITWSAAADQVMIFYNGVQQGATQNALGAWAGALAANQTIIGAANSVPATPWSGTLAHVAVWDAVDTGAIVDLAAV